MTEHKWATVQDTVEWLKERGITKTPGTVIRWCKKHKIGRQTGGRNWVVSLPALQQLLDGDDNDQTSETPAETIS